MPTITIDQLRVLEDMADELRRLGDSQDQVGSPAAYYLKQLDKALPALALRIKALVVTIHGQDELEEVKEST